jgi:hypothetical protein
LSPATFLLDRKPYDALNRKANLTAVGGDFYYTAAQTKGFEIFLKG